MTMIIMIITLIVCLLVGIPAAFSIGLSTLLYFVIERGFFNVPDLMVVNRTIFGMDSFVLLALPLFIIVGKVMNESGVTNRLFDFASSLVGHFRGGLGQVNVAASMIFSGMSGSATADAAGLGAVEIKAMKDAKYPARFACSITAASAVMGPIIPPSVALVMYAIFANVSLNQLLIAGILPGLLMGIMLAIFVAYEAVKNNYPSEKRATLKTILLTGKKSILPLLTPIILVGGILSGIFTATEAAAIGSLYAIILATVVYRTISFRKLYNIFKSSMRDSAVVMILIAVSNVFAWILIREQVPNYFTDLVVAISENYYIVMGLLVIFLSLMSMFLSTIVSISIATPVVVPLVLEVGGDPLHFGIVMVLTLIIGELTPPVGMVLFAIKRVGDIEFVELIKGVVPYLIALYLVVILIIIFPQIVVFLPNAFL
ncbi:TRAP transporter large permease [Alteribacillus bidgolensis]|uniref:TRAP transporter, DctM subunit n=1 Tax=Alteribacillus bidgolensis TaxID=930129 RepID=A0A1G8I8N4_9BACI|nr:TRAP transporter large permease [Alteribacillus bidgolensis]SDI15318.1 TRAP transporter, DctM subunit [Alteribacillus bidgolensis]